jgi:thioredoxin-dependent peroxiredoxin
MLAVVLSAALLSAGAKIEEGQPAPAVSLPATQIEKVLPDKKDAKTISLDDFKGKKNVVLYFFPKAMTKGCTIESCGFRDKLDDFAKADTVVLGISVDPLDDQVKFTDKEKLTFPLLADADKKVTDAFGVLNEKGMAKRTTFVIDKKGVVRKIYREPKVDSHPQEVLDYVKEHLVDSK